MPVLLLENVPQDVYDELEHLAHAEQRDVADLSLRLLRQVLREEETRAVHTAALADLRRRRWTPPPGTPDSVELLREDRER